MGIFKKKVPYIIIVQQKIDKQELKETPYKKKK